MRKRSAIQGGRGEAKAEDRKEEGGGGDRGSLRRLGGEACCALSPLSLTDGVTRLQLIPEPDSTENPKTWQNFANNKAAAFMLHPPVTSEAAKAVQSRPPCKQAHKSQRQQTEHTSAGQAAIGCGQ